jgi:hypothetical protein
MMEYYFSQILGVFVFICVFASMQTKNIKYVMLWQIGCNGLGMLSYVLLDGFSGSGIYMVALIQSLIFFFIRKYGKDEPRWIQPVIIVAYIACSALAFKGLIDIIPMIAAVTCALGISQKKPTNYRIIMVLNGAVWMIYDILVGAYTMLGSHVLTVIAALIGIIRLDILRKKSDS